MNKFLSNRSLSKIWNNIEVRWKIANIFVSAICSTICAVATKNLFLTFIFVWIIAIIDAFSVIEERMEGLIDWKKYFSSLFNISNYGKYLVFIIFSILPTLCGIVTKEIKLSSITDIPSIIFVNIFPNLSGALIVCSLITHISRWGQKQFVDALVGSKNGLFDVIIRLSFLACYIDAVSYKADDSWLRANYVNGAYLFFIISYGAVAVVSFLSRFVDAQPFPRRIEEVFPVQTMFLSALFLFSCGAAPLIAKVGKHEPILLLLNTITAITIFGFLLKFMACKADEDNKVYPVRQIVIFLGIVILNCIINFLLWDGEGDKLSQVVIGLTIFGFAVFILLNLNKRQTENLKELQNMKSGE